MWPILTLVWILFCKKVTALSLAKFCTAGTCIKTTTSNTRNMTLAIIQRIVFKAIRPNRPNLLVIQKLDDGVVEARVEKQESRQIMSQYRYSWLLIPGS